MHSYLEADLYFCAAAAKHHFQEFSVFQDFLEKSTGEFCSVFEIRWHRGSDKAKLSLHVMKKDFYSSTLGLEI